MRTTRIIAALGLALFSALMLYNVFYLPAISATAPAILFIASAFAAFQIYPRSR